MDSERIWVLLARKKAGEASPQELAELESLQGNTAYSNEVIDKIWDSPMHSFPEMKANPDLWDRLKKRIDHPPVIRLSPKIGWAAAACVLSIGISWLVLMHRSDLKTEQPLTASLNTVTTKPSSKVKQELPDGTQVWLNGNSQLTYSTVDFGKTKREVVLVGEAFFDVVKNEKVPFIIHAINVNITVKGTAFNVKAYPSQKNVETSLIRGLIEITTKQDPERKIILKPNEKIIIPEVGNEKTVSDIDSSQSLYSIARLQKDKNQVIAETAWMQSRLEFDNESFEHIAPKMDSWFSVSIHFNDSAIASRRFSAVIEKESLQQTLEALKLSYPFNYQIKGSEIWISKK
jgi:ferric-dicitrate binding protein FerR (iron transport regulator)